VVLVGIRRHKEIDQTNADRQTKDTPVVGGMVVESSKARAVVADGNKCWGRDLLSDLARVRTF
jgi:hypothetical protein